MLITDGHSSKTASVTNNNRLNVKSSTVKEAVIVSINKEFTFIAEQNFTTQGLLLDGFIQALSNLDPSRVIVVASIDIEVSAADALGSVRLTRNPDIDTPNLTNDATIDPVNLNFGSGKQGLVQSIGHDGVGDGGIGGITGGVDFAARSTAVQTEFSFSSIEGLIILQQGDELGLKADVNAAGVIVSSSITYYLQDEGN